MVKRLLILGGGEEQRHAVSIAKELGATVLVFDGYGNGPCAGYADEYYTVNIKDRSALLALAEKTKPDAVIVHAAELAIEAAAIVDHLGLPGLTGEIAWRGTDKATRSETLKKAGIKMPRHIALKGDAAHDNWIKGAEKLGFPLVAKPTRLAGAKGVRLIENQAGLSQYFESRAQYGEQDYLLEEVISGVQLSTETVFLDRLVLHTNIALRHYDTTARFLPAMIEDGHSMPWALNEQYRDRIEGLMTEAATAIGVETGVIKGDLILTAEDDLITLEMAVRSSGGRFADTVSPLATGVNILYPMIAGAMQVPCPDRLYRRAETCGVSQRFIWLPEGTPLRHPLPIQSLKRRPYVEDVWFRSDLAALKTAPHILSHHDRLGYVICTGPSAREADDKAIALVKEIEAHLRGDIS